MDMVLSVLLSERASSSPKAGGGELLRQSSQDLNKALVAQDLLAARRAFARMLLALPGPGGSASGTPIAELGSALAVGDIGAARSAFATVSKLRLSAQVGGGAVAPVSPSSTGGMAGGLLNEVA